MQRNTLFVFSLFQILTLGSLFLFAEMALADEPSAGEVIGDVVISGSQQVASGVSITGHASADSLDNLSWAGCAIAKWAVGQRRDRSPSVGNTIVGLLFRLPVSLVSGSTCATAALLAMPSEGIAYSFGVLSGKDNTSPHGIEDPDRQYAEHR